MGLLLLGISFLAEVLFIAGAFCRKRVYGKEKAMVRGGGALLLLLLGLTGVWGIADSCRLFAAVLLVQTAFGMYRMVRGQNKPLRKGRMIVGAVGNLLLYTLTLTPVILFPQYDPPAVTGSCQVQTAEYTWVDESRTESYTNTGEHRALTVKFWYPKEEGKYPLVLFSHGAFGVIESNTSTCIELASNGYVVASIGHSYHAMYVKDVNGKITFADRDFVRQVYEDNGTKDAEGEKSVYLKGLEWMEIRTADENFVLDTTLEKVKDKKDTGEEELFSRIDTEKIGLFGHSMGGASSVQLGRERDDIDAVIDLEGTMFGEYIGFENGTEVFNERPYPIPLLDVNSREIYSAAEELEKMGMEYVNLHVVENAINAREVTFEGAGHLNFTDLPLVSPILAKMLGVGTVDAKTCIEDVNEVMLAFFDCYLKGDCQTQIKTEY